MISRHKFRMFSGYCRLTGKKCSESFDPINDKPRFDCSNCKYVEG